MPNPNPREACSSDLIEQTLDAVGTQGRDITNEVYRRFFELRPEAREFFQLDELDPQARGRMLAEVLTLVLDGAQGEGYVGPTMRTHVADHTSYGVAERGHYEAFLQALIECVQESAGKSWSPEAARAWREQAEHLLSAAFAKRKHD